MNKRNKDRNLLTSSQCSFAYTWRNKTTSLVKTLFLLTNKFPPFVKKMPIWFTWKAKENFITCIWYLARRKKITGILGSKSEWMIELHRVVCPFRRYNFCKELCQRIPTENIASDSRKWFNSHRKYSVWFQEMIYFCYSQTTCTTLRSSSWIKLTTLSIRKSYSLLASRWWENMCCN